LVVFQQDERPFHLLRGGDLGRSLLEYSRAKAEADISMTTSQFTDSHMQLLVRKEQGKDARGRDQDVFLYVEGFWFDMEMISEAMEI